jgi:EpsI family protein
MRNLRIAENTSFRLLLVTAVLAGAFAGARFLRRGHGQPGDVRSQSVDFEQIPRQLGVWTAVLGPTGVPAVEKPYDAMAHLVRLYRNPARQVVSLEIDAFTLWDNAAPHPPEVCYSAGGYSEVGSKEVSLERAAEEETARLLTFRDGTRQFCVLYWYQVSGQITVDRLGVLSIDRAVWQRAARPPVLKIMLLTGASQEDAAEERLRSIAAALRASLKRPL